MYYRKILLKNIGEYKEPLLKNAPEAARPNINLAILYSVKIILPPLDQQNKFAQIVQKTEQQKDLLQQSLTELENNFNSLMQKAFKGELFN